MRARMAAALVLAIAGSLIVATPAHADAVRDQQYWLDTYGIRAAWAVTRGEGVTIAVIDTGVDGSVAELAGAVRNGADFSGLGSADGQQPVGSESGHGTMVASLAAGRGTGANAGVIGSAPAATIMPLSIGFGVGSTSSDDQIAAAVRYAVDNGADIINMSLTRNTLDWPESWDEAFLHAEQNDVVVIAAAGNRGSGTTVVGAPATMPGVLTVGGVDENGRASFDASSQGITIGVTAPSENLVGVIPGGSHVLWDGTSGATPIVAGVAALVRAAHPRLDAANVINRIIGTAKDAGASGPDPLYGFGLLDAYAAVTATLPLVDENPMGQLQEWITLYRRADAPPTPLPTPTPAPPPVPRPLEPEAADPLGTILPTLTMLRGPGVAALVVLAFLAAFGSAAAVGLRRIGRARRGE